MVVGQGWNFVFSRIVCGSFALFVLLGTLAPAKAQYGQTPLAESVEIPRDRLQAIEDELRYLRARDVERQAWESSVAEKFPASGTVLASNYEAIQPSSCGCNSLEFPAESYGCSCNCNCCQCYPCQCPLDPAPCIECPHVSTLSPYFNVSFFGALKLDMIFGGARAISPGTPFFLFPGPTPGFDDNYVSVHARQSTLGAAFAGPQFGGFQSGGQVIVMFFNDNVIADQYGILPLQAYGDLRNEDWRFAAGLQFDVFAPGTPTVLPFSSLAGSGNSGNAFRGQLRLERFITVSDVKQWTIQTALSEPVVSTINPDFRLLEDNGWPNIEGRIALGLGAMEGQGPAAKRPFEVGASAVVGQLRDTDPGVRQVVANVFGISTDLRWKLTDCYGIAGELYAGQGLGTYNGAVLQNVNSTTLQAIRSSGGFGEFYYYWTPCLHSHFGYGVDNPINRDVNVFGRTFNSTYYANALWDVNATFRIGFELTYRETQYRGLNDNEGAGLQTQFQWAF
ncbi:hypothetical protein LOC68_10685 [Blastopirellula sp. JC732]|uniref:Porin n=1 Tax=Blastopirellula sediminis TaxID=2894196 RepID=A0A9X1MMA3_9BACT|nr:hypothetical protein [Blastopirellula sediminis]MCC9608358.1 hypothetical protein [Blastopirellula sediminis]MCC9628865.1 hypothetical protein [Blastopirellula sediminis]